MSDLPGYPMSNFTSSQLPNNHDANVHASVLLRTLIAEAPAEAFTLGWLIGNLRQRSFGALILVLAIVALVPVGISIPAGLLIAFLAVQVILGYRNAILPNPLMMRPLPSRYLWLIKDYIIPLLIHLETAVRPRWPAFVDGMLRVAGVAVLLLAVILLTLPLPLVNIPIAGAIVIDRTCTNRAGRASSGFCAGCCGRCVRPCVGRRSGVGRRCRVDFSISTLESIWKVARPGAALTSDPVYQCRVVGTTSSMQASARSIDFPKPLAEPPDAS